MQNHNISLVTPPAVKLKELKNLFLQLSLKKCNMDCKYCYTKRDELKKEDNFLNLDKIKMALSVISKDKLESIYLTGGEPLMHPDFNRILRMCLKFTNVTILTNGTMINEKKARFLRKIDDESIFETIFRISLDSADEAENDSMRGRGSFRKAVFAIMSLYKYEFNPIISVVNYKNKSREAIFNEFQEYFSKKGFKLENINLKIIPYFSYKLEIMENNTNNLKDSNFDCNNSRVISNSGVYACPMLVEDYRARMGSTLDNSSKTNYLDCEYCSLCASANQKVMVNDWM